MLQVAFEDADSSRYMKMGICAALYLVLAMIWLPGFSLDRDIQIVVEDLAPKKRVVLSPPPEKPIERKQLQERKATKVPMPDQSPDDPEPIVEPDPPPAPDMVYADDDWEIGIPEERPPTQQGPLIDGMVGVESPLILKRVKPEYPKRGAAVRLQGHVFLSAVLRKDGTIGDIKVLRGLGKGKFGFEEAAIEAVRGWEFVPGKFQNKPADIVLNLRIEFKLN
jgi:protein TonB